MSAITFKVTDPVTTCTCEKTLDLDAVGCPQPSPPLWSVPDAIDFARVASPGNNLLRFAALPNNKCVLPPVDSNASCMDTWDFATSPATISYGFVYPDPSSVMYCSAYEPITNKIVAIIETAGPIQNIAFFSPTTGLTTRYPFVIETHLADCLIPMVIRGEKKVAFFEKPFTGGISAHIYVCDCLLETVNELDIPAVDSEWITGPATYCCVSNEFAVLSYRDLGLGVNEYYLKMIDANFGTENSRYVLGNDYYFPEYIDSSEEILLQSDYSVGPRNWKLFDPLTGTVDLTVPFPAPSPQIYYKNHYDFYLDAVIVDAYDTTLGNYILSYYNPTDMTFIKSVDVSSGFSIDNMSSSPDDGTLFFQRTPSSGVNTCWQVRPIIL